MPSGLYLGTCERCSCHGHTEVCEPETGACQVSPPLSLLPQGSVASRGPASAPRSACPRNVSTIQRAPGVSSASLGTTGTPSVGHHTTASRAPATERPLPASASSPFPKCPVLCPRLPSSQALLRGSG